MIELFPKLIQLDEITKHGEPSVQILRPHEYNRLYHVKAASDALDYIKQVEPQPGKTIILVLAMTAGEFYGCNRNGDAWPERPLVVGNTRITEDQVLPLHYKSFESNANVFRHHVNKDPEKKIGDVLKAFYNWPMHRVELLLALDNRRAEEIVDEIERGLFPAVSMGCKVRYDVCSICGHMARNRSEYCDDAKYRLTDTLPNGKVVFVWNPAPKFFDLSMVRRPADKLGYMMKKVAESVPEIHSSAELGEYVENATRKIGGLRKLSIIHKILRGEIAAAKGDDGILSIKKFSDGIAKPVAEQMPPIDDTVIRSLLQHRPAEVLSTLASMGIFLTTPEFIKFFAWKLDPSIEIPDEALDRAVAAQQQIFDFLAENPELLDEVEDTGFLDIAPENVNPDLAQELKPLAEKRSQHEDFLYKRALDYRPGQFDLVQVTGPGGQVYQTTKAQARAAQEKVDRMRREKTKSLIGGGALLAGGLALLPYRGLRLLAPLVGGAGVMQLGKGMKAQPQTFQADTGETLYAPEAGYTQSGRGFPGTELALKRASFDRLDMTNATIRMAMDFAHRKNARNKKVAAITLDTFSPDFNAAAAQIGEVICP